VTFNHHAMNGMMIEVCRPYLTDHFRIEIAGSGLPLARGLARRAPFN
jgi:hypothetical protein